MQYNDALRRKLDFSVGFVSALLSAGTLFEIVFRAIQNAMPIETTLQAVPIQDLVSLAMANCALSIYAFRCFRFDR